MQRMKARTCTSTTFFYNLFFKKQSLIQTKIEKSITSNPRLVNGVNNSRRTHRTGRKALRRRIKCRGCALVCPGLPAAADGRIIRMRTKTSPRAVVLRRVSVFTKMTTGHAQSGVKRVWYDWYYYYSTPRQRLIVPSCFRRFEI
jgi:hypothetical protein